jgi:acetyl-CoA C-acetyltransferase
MNDIVIVAAARTVQGRFLGSLAKKTAVELALEAGRPVVATIGADSFDQVIVGNVLAAGQGMNVARQIGIGLGVPVDRVAFSVNMMCASGMQAVILASQAIRAGDARCVLCGGTESMSNAPYLLDRARAGYSLGDGALIDCLLRDGLIDAFSKTHMGLMAEALAESHAVDRGAQDAFALRSQKAWAAAHARGAFKGEIVPVAALAQDEHPRPDGTLEKLATLKPAFKAGGTVTPGNSSGINDGAALLAVCDAELARQKGWRPLARISGVATVGCEPALVGLGPVYATRTLCAAHGIGLDSFDAIEINEAFAAQVLACLKDMALPAERVNVNGGAIALGHPIGASGARLVVHLAHRVARAESKRALATLCVGGGMGAALMLEPA